MGKPIVYGPRYSVYTRAVIMALIEKKVAYDLVHIEMDNNEHRAPEHLKRHPFGMLPAFEHNGFMIYETVPILAYIDDAFPEEVVRALAARGHKVGRATGASYFGSSKCIEVLADGVLSGAADHRREAYAVGR